MNHRDGHGGAASHAMIAVHADPSAAAPQNMPPVSVIAAPQRTQHGGARVETERQPLTLNGCRENARRRYSSARQPPQAPSAATAVPASHVVTAR